MSVLRLAFPREAKWIFHQKWMVAVEEEKLEKFWSRLKIGWDSSGLGGRYLQEFSTSTQLETETIINPLLEQSKLLSISFFFNQSETIAGEMFINSVFQSASRFLSKRNWSEKINLCNEWLQLESIKKFKSLVNRIFNYSIYLIKNKCLFKASSILNFYIL